MSKRTQVTLTLVLVFVAWGIGMSFVAPLSNSEDTKGLGTFLILALLGAAILIGMFAVRAINNRRS